VSKNNFEPRVGLAWKLNESGKTVVRAGAGIYHNQILPYMYANNISNPPSYGRFSVSNPTFPNGVSLLKPGALLTVIAYPEVEKTPVSNQYNLSIQQQLPSTTVLQVSYAGNRSFPLETEREKTTTVPPFLNGNPATPFYPASTPRI